LSNRNIDNIGYFLHYSFSAYQCCSVSGLCKGFGRNKIPFVQFPMFFLRILGEPSLNCGDQGKKQ